MCNSPHFLFFPFVGKCARPEPQKTRKTKKEKPGKGTRSRREQKVDGQYTAVTPSRRVKRCEGCRAPFTHHPDLITLKRYENNPYRERASNTMYNSWRDYYYHVNIACVARTNANGPYRVQVEGALDAYVVRPVLVSAGFSPC